MSDGAIFVVKIHPAKIRGKMDYEGKNPEYVREYPEYVTAIEFQRQSYMAFVITQFMETRSQYTVVLEFDNDKVFRLQKNHKKSYWEKEDGLYSFTLCKTGEEAWTALGGFVYQLVEGRKDLLRKLSKGSKGDWGPDEKEAL